MARRKTSVKKKKKKLCSSNYSEAAPLVTINKFSSLTGLTESAIRNYIYQGTWMENKQYIRIGKSGSLRKRVLIKYEAVMEWFTRGK